MPAPRVSIDPVRLLLEVHRDRLCLSTVLALVVEVVTIRPSAGVIAHSAALTAIVS